MKTLGPGYSTEVDLIDKAKWNNLLTEFDDPSFFQTWSYGAKTWGERRLSHIVLTKDGQSVSIAQVRVNKLPGLPGGFAYITWGPIWRRRGGKRDLAILQNMIRAVYNEYVVKQRLFLRILPKVLEYDHDLVLKVFEEEGFVHSPDQLDPVIINLSPPLEDLRRNLGRGWRETLNRAEKKHLEIIDGSDDSFCEAALKLVKEMKTRKAFVEFGSMKSIIEVHKDLPEDLNLKMLFSKLGDETLAVVGFTGVGKVGQLLIAATGDKALKLKAAYPVYWKMIEYYKANGFERCDLGGVNQQTNPGGHYFKTGLAGKNYEDRKYIGQFDACENCLSSILFKSLLFSRDRYRRFVSAMNRLKKSHFATEKTNTARIDVDRA